MADQKISDLSAAGALTGTELIETVQGGVNVKTTTQDIADLGGGSGGHVIEDEGTPLTQRANMNFVGAGVTATDAGGKTVVTIPASISDTAYDATSWNGVTDIAPSKNAVRDKFETIVAGTDKYVIDQASASTSGGTITLDMNSQIQRIFTGSAAFSAAKTMAWSNVTEEKGGVFHFEITNVTAELTMPSEVKMNAPGSWDGTIWSPNDIGEFIMAWWFDGTTRKVVISGPFT